MTIIACTPDDDGPGPEDTEAAIEATYDPKPYELDVPTWMPDMPVVEENPLTEAGVNLGRHLFYDPILSADSTMACSGCHAQEFGFTDALAVSVGIDGIAGKRSSMSLANVGFFTKGLFWDGRSETLEIQALAPVEDPIELHDDWGNVEVKLRRHIEYPKMFREAFGIEYPSEITRDLAVKAIAQFERIMVSGMSRFDRIKWLNEGFPTEEEQLGESLFFFELSQTVDHPGCSHCHGGPLFTDNSYRNNGLDSVETLNDFEDLGLGGVNGNVFDNGKFRTPSLRNIALTPPYMHDGRFATLEEVIDHYSSGGHIADNLDSNIRPFSLTEEEKAALVAFMNSLTDTSFVNNPIFSNPFN